MPKDRCERYKDDNTYGFGKNYVYKYCKNVLKRKHGR